MTPVVELLRVSTEIQAGADRAGLPAQHAANVRTCGMYELTIVQTVEIVESGAEVAQTPAMAQVLEAVTSGRARGVVLAEYSRLFRPDRWSDLVVLQTFCDYDARIFLPSGPIDLQTEIGFVQATINNLLAAMERRRIRERMDRGKEEHRRRGEHVAGGVGIPFGMAYDRKAGWSWTPDAERVRELFRRVLAGARNFEALARELAIPRTNVRWLLQNEVYTGWRIYDERRDMTPAGKYSSAPKSDRRKIGRRPEDVLRVRLPLEPLVSDDDFAFVQDILAEKAATIQRGSYQGEFTYAGLLECMCGQRMYAGRKNQSHEQPTFYYYCRSHITARRPAGVERCGNGYLVREHLEAVLDRAVARQLMAADYILRAIGVYARSLESSWRAAAPNVGAIEQQVQQLVARRGRVVDAFVDGLIDRVERDRRVATIEGELAAARRLLGGPPQATPPAVAERMVQVLVEAFSEWGLLERAQRQRILARLAPTFYVRKYAVEGVRFPAATLGVRGNNDSHCPTAAAVHTSEYRLSAGGLYIPLGEAAA